MDYKVELSPRAFADVDAIVEYISADSSENATRWRGRLFSKIATLGNMPRSCSVAEENERCRFEIRQMFFGRHRILFTIREQDSLVYVLTIRHGARRMMSGQEIDGIE